MKLADKPVHPITDSNLGTMRKTITEPFGLTFREALILSLCSNPRMCDLLGSDEVNARIIIKQADAIIKLLES